MKHHLYLSFLLIFVTSFQNGHAQISITYPLEKCVFQRDHNNRATIYVAGNFSEYLDMIQVKVTPVQPGWGQESDWMVLVDQPSTGFYYGDFEWVAGWYTLEVRGRKNGNTLGTASVNRVGIGEVFLIAGQSNAQGYFGNGAQSASDERVIHVNYDGIFGPNAPLPYPNFSHLDAEDVISPRGKSAWIWGKLGDALSNKLNVPVLFYNVAWDGSGVKSWIESIHGIAWSVYNPSIPFEPVGMPYGNFRNVMRNYVSITGLRAVFWIQGEADNDVGTSQDAYYGHLEHLISHTRHEFNLNLSWVVARASYTVNKGIGGAIINAQNQIIQNLPNVFAGPNMDEIQVPRPDGYHLYGPGLEWAADAWNNALNNEFFSNSHPQKARAPIRIFTSCNQNSLTIHTEGAYHDFRWNNGSNQSSITPGEGTYQVSAYDAEGNYRFSPRIQIPGNVGSAQPPTISSVGPPEVCEGGTLTLVSSSDRNPVWSNGQSGIQTQVHSPGQYTVTIENLYGCKSESAPFTVHKSNKVLPDPPVITANRSTEICAGEEVTLSSNSGTNTYWSNGENNKASTLVKNAGAYYARTRDAEGCFSNPSNTLEIKVNDLPSKPTVSSTSPTTFCDGGETTLKSSYSTGIVWSNNSTTETIVVKNSGEYRVTYTDDKGCKNTSDPVRVTVHPLPPAPVATSLRPLSFCEGDYTILTTDELHSYTWSNGANSREIRLSEGGNYWVTTTDQNGCTSPRSNTLTVTVNPLPARPTIRIIGEATFCENSEVTLEAPEATGYLWNNGGTTRSLTIKTSGSFSVQTLNEFGCRSPRSENVVTKTLPIPSPPVIRANGPTDICDVSQVRLTATGSPPFIWSTEATSSYIEVGETGTYTATSLGSNGCHSNPSNAIEVTVRITPEVPKVEKSGAFSIRVTNHLDGAAYIWHQNNQLMTESQNAFLRLRSAGNYQVQAFKKYTDDLTCYSELSASQFFEIDAFSKNLNAFPNPTREHYFYLETSEIIANAVVTIYSLQGHLLASYAFDELSVPVKITLPEHLSGVYLIKVTGKNYNASTKLLVSN